ncbi:MAG: hypothetical protein VKJ09_04890 [Leptolyngbya sp.]|nr:hypothetical protein [Leptolyngbya sp.]
MTAILLAPRPHAASPASPQPPPTAQIATMGQALQSLPWGTLARQDGGRPYRFVIVL